ncbi:VOC family protein [Streptosporangium sp. CA-135522]|uniref:VOC family protein n=1 Tax=Streptosporangium sp. CA-135522 TaxID=3240072 RepID=UPI003D92EC82
MQVLTTYARLYVDDLDTALPSLTELTGADPQWREGFGDLELAGISRFLLVAGTPEALAPYRDTQGTAVVADIDEVEHVLKSHGAEIVGGPLDAPNGRGLTARHRGGAVIEYVQWHDELRERVLSAPQEPAPILATYARLYVDGVDVTLPPLTELTGAEPALRFDYGDLELAGLEGFLLVAGTPGALAPFRETHATAIITDLAVVQRILRTHGGQVLAGPEEVPTGRNMTVRHAGGAIIEYVEFSSTVRAEVIG